MSAQAQLKELVNTLMESGVNQERINELQESFNDQQIEVFLEKLSTFEDLDILIDDTSGGPDKSNQLIDIVSDLIINQ